MFCTEASHQGYPQGPDAMDCLRASYAGNPPANVALYVAYFLSLAKRKECSDTRVNLRRLQEPLSVRWRPSGLNATKAGTCGR